MPDILAVGADGGGAIYLDRREIYRDDYEGTPEEPEPETSDGAAPTNPTNIGVTALKTDTHDHCIPWARLGECSVPKLKTLIQGLCPQACARISTNELTLHDYSIAEVMTLQIGPEDITFQPELVDDLCRQAMRSCSRGRPSLPNVQRSRSVLDALTVCITLERMSRCRL